MTKERKIELLSKFGFDNLVVKIDDERLFDFDNEFFFTSIETTHSQVAKKIQNYVHNEISLECEQDDEHVDILGGSINDMLQILDKFEKEIINVY